MLLKYDLLTKLTNIFAKKEDVPKIYYGTCSTSANSQVKEITTSNDYTLEEGLILFVKFTYGNTYTSTSSNPTYFKVNNSSTNVPVQYVTGQYSVQTHWGDFEAVGFIYDGDNFVMVNEGVATTNKWGVTKLTDSVSSESTTTSATPNSVKTAYDLANGKADATHNHGKLQSNGQVGTTAVNNGIVVTDSNGLISASSSIDGEKIITNTIRTSKFKTYSSAGQGGVQGYVKVLQLERTATNYPDKSITFTVRQRHQKEPQYCNLRFTSNNVIDNFNVASFTYTNSDDTYIRGSGGIYLYKESATVWSLIVKKSEAYDSVYIHDMDVTTTNLTVTPLSNALLTELPSEPVTSLPTTNDQEHPLVKATYNGGGTKADITHTHGNLQNNGQIGSNAINNGVVVTDGTGKITASQTIDGRNLTDFSIGSANILNETKSFTSPSPTNSSINGTYNDCNVRYVKNTGSTNIDFTWSIPLTQLEPNGFYTLSFWAKTTTEHSNIRTYFYRSGENTTEVIKTNSSYTPQDTNTNKDGATIFTITDEWKRYYVTYQLNNTPLTNNKSLTIQLYNNTSIQPDVYLCGVKFEKSSVPTDWCPSQNDKSDATHTHGNITNDGKVTTASNDTFQYFVGVGNSTNTLYKSQYLRADKIKDVNAHSHIGSSANDTQQTINNYIDSELSKRPLKEIKINGGNLDVDSTYLEPGLYYCDDNNQAPTIDSLPNDAQGKGFALLVDGGERVKRQILTLYTTSNPRTFIRTYNDWNDSQGHIGWGDWQELSYMTDISTKLDVGSIGFLDYTNEYYFDAQNTTPVTTTVNPSYHFNNDFDWIFSCDVNISGNRSTRIELSPKDYDRKYHIAFGLNTSGVVSIWHSTGTNSEGSYNFPNITLDNSLYYTLKFIKKDNKIKVYFDDEFLKEVTVYNIQNYKNYLVKLTSWNTNSGINIKNIYGTLNSTITDSDYSDGVLTIK